MTAAAVPADRQAILLLCSSLALPRTPDAPKPLTRSEWNAIARALDQANLRPGALIGAGTGQLTAVAAGSVSLAERLTSLLERGAQLAIEIDRLTALGIWTVTRADERYPTLLKERLRAQAPPVLFGAGPADALGRRGLAIVGSRDVDAAGTTFAQALGQRCAESQLVVLSGGARGVDRQAMHAAMAAGGQAVAVLAESLEQTVRNRETRDAVLEGRLTLVTPYHPAAGFSVGNAMGRNKVIYALSTWACVVSSGVEEGGTWTGALENLQGQWAPLFVRAGADVPEGNRRLLQRGAAPISADDVAQNLAEFFDAAAAAAGKASETDDRPDFFAEVWPHLRRYLQQPRTESEIMSAFGLLRPQAKAWLARAVEEGRALKLNKPIRFQAIVADPRQKDLFEP